MKENTSRSRRKSTQSENVSTRDPRSFNARLRDLLWLRGKSQTEVARSMNIQQRDISDYVNGEKLPRLQTFVAFAKYFDVSADWLLGLTDRLYAPGYVEYIQSESEDVIPVWEQLSDREKRLVADFAEHIYSLRPQSRD